MAAGERVVLAGEHVVAVTAWAGRFRTKRGSCRGGTRRITIG